MKIYVQPGKILPYTNAGGALLSGAPVVLGNGMVGIVQGDIAASGTGQVAVEEVFTLPTDTGTAWSQGDRVWYNGTVFTKTAVANQPAAGFAAVAKASGAATCAIKLWPSSVGLAVFQAQVSTADGSDPTTTQALANALKVKINALMTALINAGVMASS